MKPNTKINFCWIMIIIIVVFGVGYLVIDKIDLDNRICQSFGGKLKPSNTTCDFLNTPEECQKGLCILPNGSEFYTSDIKLISV